MAKPPREQRRQHVIQADRSAQRPNNSYCPVTLYQDKRVPCAGCGRAILWTAEQQRTWYEEIKASIYATVTLRCDACRKRGRHDANRQRQRSKARRRGGGQAERTWC